MILGHTRSLARNLMKDYGKLGYRPGNYQIDPNHYHIGIPMSTPGDRVWPGVQKDNGVTGLLIAPNYLGGRNPLQTSLAKTDRIQKQNQAFMGFSQGPASFAQLMGLE